MLMKIGGVLCTLLIGAVIGALFVAPKLLHGGAGIGILIFLVCPVVMMLLMFGMNKNEKTPMPPPPGSTNGSADAP